VRNRKIIEVKV